MMRANLQSALPVILLLVASCSSSQTATTQPDVEKPKGVLDFRVLATKDDPDADKRNKRDRFDIDGDHGVA